MLTGTNMCEGQESSSLIPNESGSLQQVPCLELQSELCVSRAHHLLADYLICPPGRYPLASGVHPDWQKLFTFAYSARL